MWNQIKYPKLIIMIIVGSTYIEECIYPTKWYEVYGSGFRAVRALQHEIENIDFFTYASGEIRDAMPTMLEKKDIRLIVTEIDKTLCFRYFHGLSEPKIYPNILRIKKSAPLEVNGDTVLRYGFLEGDAIVHGKKVVYDPQSSYNPVEFYSNGSTADELVYILNKKEAILLTGCDEPEGIAKKLLTYNTIAVILKMGPSGGFVFTKDEKKEFKPYKTDHVFPIGTGDIFSAFVSLYWGVKGYDIDNAAQEASKMTALYSSNYNYYLPIKNISLEGLNILGDNHGDKSIYLAAPFFNIAQRWLVEEARDALRSKHIKVFSPVHDVGYGIAGQVASKDIAAIKKCDVMFAIGGNLDPGTIFEIGYARSINKSVVVYVENEREEDLKMIKGTDCIIESDFVTAIYKTIWCALEKK